MNFINEEHSRDYISLAFLSPFWHFFVNLFSNFMSDLSSCSRKEGQKALRTRVNDIDFMQSDSMNYLLSFFNLSFRTVHKSGLGSHGVIIWCSRKTSSGFGNLSWSFIDCDDVSSDDFLFLDGFDHFLTQIVDSFHLCCFESDFACFGARS